MIAVTAYPDIYQHIVCPTEVKPTLLHTLQIQPIKVGPLHTDSPLRKWSRRRIRRLRPTDIRLPDVPVIQHRYATITLQPIRIYGRDRIMLEGKAGVGAADDCFLARMD